jgi:hypothetical protein
MEHVLGAAPEADAPFSPDWASPPWETISETLALRNVHEDEFRRKMGWGELCLQGVKRGDVALSESDCQNLSRFLGVTVLFWKNRQALFLEARDRLRNAGMPTPRTVENS